MMALNSVCMYDVSYGSMYTQNNRVPWVEPWGAPQVRWVTEEEASLTTTAKFCLINWIKTSLELYP